MYFQLFCKAKYGEQSCFSFFTVLTNPFFFLVRKLDEYFYFLPETFFSKFEQSRHVILKSVSELNTEDFRLYEEHGMTSSNFNFILLIKMIHLMLPFIKMKSNFCPWNTVIVVLFNLWVWWSIQQNTKICIAVTVIIGFIVNYEFVLKKKFKNA